MERFPTQQVNIYPDQARRVRLRPTDFVDPKALFFLFKDTMSGSNKIKYPFQVRTSLITDKWYKKYPPDSGFIAVYPYAYYSPRHSSYPESILSEPMYGALIVVNIDSFPDFFTTSDVNIDHLLNQPPVCPALMAANFIFLHEWGHAVKVAVEGFDPTIATSLLTKEFINQNKALETDNWCENFALRYLEKIVRGKAPFPIKRILSVQLYR